jgi:hypothetical protein
MNQEDIIFMLGGKVTYDNLPSSFPSEFFSLFCEFPLAFTRIRISDYASNTDCRVDLEITNSPSVACRSREISRGNYLIVVPMGALVRIRVLSRILLRYWHRSDAPDFEPQDITGDEQRIPPALFPIFNENYSDYWHGIDSFDETLDMAEFESDVQALVVLAFYFLVGHELAHVLRRHEFIIAKMVAELSPSPSQLKAVLWRFAEIDADIMGLHWALHQISYATAARRAAAKNQSDKDKVSNPPELAWVRLAYAVTLVFGSYDVWRRELGNYSAGRYPHPLARWQISSAVVREYVRLDALHSRDDKLDALTRQQEFGYIKCTDAFKWLDYDIKHEVFGPPNPGSEFTSITTLIIDESNHDVIQREFWKDTDLYTAVINMFLTVADDEDVWAEGVGFALEPEPVLHARRTRKGSWKIVGENLSADAYDILQKFMSHPRWGVRFRDSLLEYSLVAGPYERLRDSAPHAITP